MKVKTKAPRTNKLLLTYGKLLKEKEDKNSSRALRV